MQIIMTMKSSMNEIVVIQIILTHDQNKKITRKITLIILSKLVNYEFNKIKTIFR